jgi:hypothetical protein
MAKVLAAILLHAVFFPPGSGGTAILLTVAKFKQGVEKSSAELSYWLQFRGKRGAAAAPFFRIGQSRRFG